MSAQIATPEDIEKLKAHFSDELAKLTSLVQTIRKEQLSEWLTVEETAKHLRLTPATIRRKVHSGHFDTRREGKKILIHRDCIDIQSSR